MLEETKKRKNNEIDGNKLRVNKLKQKSQPFELVLEKCPCLLFDMDIGPREVSMLPKVLITGLSKSTM